MTVSRPSVGVDVSARQIISLKYLPCTDLELELTTFKSRSVRLFGLVKFHPLGSEISC